MFVQLNWGKKTHTYNVCVPISATQNLYFWMKRVQERLRLERFGNESAAKLPLLVYNRKNFLVIIWLVAIQL